LVSIIFLIYMFLIFDILGIWFLASGNGLCKITLEREKAKEEMKGGFVSASKSVGGIPSSRNKRFLHILYCFSVFCSQFHQTIYKLLLSRYSIGKKLQNQIVRRQKLCKTILYKKAARKMLVKLISGLYTSKWQSFKNIIKLLWILRTFKKLDTFMKLHTISFWR